MAGIVGPRSKGSLLKFFPSVRNKIFGLPLKKKEVYLSHYLDLILRMF